MRIAVLEVKLLVVIVAILVLLAGIAAARYLERARVRSLALVSEEEFHACRPPDIAPQVWRELGVRVAESFEIPFEKLAPSQTIADLHDKLKFLEISTIDVDVVLENALGDAGDPQDHERLRARLAVQPPVTVGDLMELILRETTLRNRTDSG